MKIPDNLQYTGHDEWVRAEGNALAVGISDFAQDQLGELVHVELQAVGKQVKAGEVVCEVESVKAMAEIYSPANGKVVAVNTALDDCAEQINADPYGSSIYKLEVATPPTGLIDAAAYQAKVGWSSATAAAVSRRSARGAADGDRRKLSHPRSTMSSVPPPDAFVRRHIGPSESETGRHAARARRRLARRADRRDHPGDNPGRPDRGPARADAEHAQHVGGLGLGTDRCGDARRRPGAGRRTCVNLVCRAGGNQLSAVSSRAESPADG